MGVLLLIDAGSGGLTPPRAALWTGLSVLLFVILTSQRVSAGRGWLASRGLLRERQVCTDCLVSVRWVLGVSQRLVLRDLYGVRVEIGPRVLAANPDIWCLLEHDARTSCERGLLTYGATALRQLSRRIDSETARLLLKISNMK